MVRSTKRLLQSLEFKYAIGSQKILQRFHGSKIRPQGKTIPASRSVAYVKTFCLNQAATL